MRPNSALPTIRVVAGALFDAQGRVLIAQRPVGKHMAGRWEFPGGKIQAGESELAALRRELNEELGVTLEDAERMLELSHDYPERRVQLCMWRVTAYRGEPRTLDGQALKWVDPADLASEDLLEADRPIVLALQESR
ncbi:MAG TPA: 8-oxo-dGTP diphosphatase MutT [Steroidobacteraceae bacterium]|nr:8-oxo-dGTP diphosphatase MutT [Steroidobacteraceae bacterium]